MGKYKKKAEIGRGYPLRMARKLVEALTAACNASRPNEDSWTKPLATIHVVAPVFCKEAEVGDIATWRDEVARKVASTGATQTAEFWFAGFVVKGGKAPMIRAHDGREFAAPAKTKYLAISQFDAEAVRSDLARRYGLFAKEALWGTPWGCFDDAGGVASALTKYMVHGEVTLPDAAAAARVIETVGVLDTQPPRAVDRGALQAALYEIVLGKAS